MFQLEPADIPSCPDRKSQRPCPWRRHAVRTTEAPQIKSKPDCRLASIDRLVECPFRAPLERPGGQRQLGPVKGIDDQAHQIAMCPAPLPRRPVSLTVQELAMVVSKKLVAEIGVACKVLRHQATRCAWLGKAPFPCGSSSAACRRCTWRGWKRASPSSTPPTAQQPCRTLTFHMADLDH